GVVFSIVIVVGALGLGASWFLLDREQNRVLQKARDALDKHDSETAIALFDKALELHLPSGRAAWAYQGRGRAESEKGRYADAIRDLSEALRLNPRGIDAYYARGYAFQLNGDLDSALRDYAEYLRRDENAGGVYFNRGLIYLQRKEWAKAVADFSESIRCEPQQSYAYFDRGSALAQLGALDGALASLDAAISMNPTFAEAYQIRAMVHRKRGELDRAQTDERAATTFAPKTAPSTILGPTRSAADLLNDARLAELSKRYDEGIDLCDKALATKLTPSFMSNAYMTRGNCYAGEGDWDKALRDYGEAVRIQPNNYDALTNRGNAYAHKRELAKSTDDYSEALRLNPKVFQAYYNRALNYLATSDLDRALADLTEAIRLNPKFTQAYTRRSAVLIRLKRRDEALKDADTAVSLSPDDAEAYLSRGRLRVNRREFLQARADYQKAIEHLGNGQPTLLNDAAWFFATCPDKACRDGKKAVDLATRACEMRQWRDSQALDTLAAAFAEVGDFDQAIKRQSDALKFYERSDDVRTRMQKRLALYQRHHPFRQEPIP
ncbi:MAG TPA: tetratricopeptide repeat protein, partial [Chthoniobacterales bacterium]|nr:tetratricopeptide repeat protein [Chthoniobacterales bacterium]